MRMFHRARALPMATLVFMAIAFGSLSPFAVAEPASETPEQTGLMATATPPALEQNPSRRLAELRSKLDRTDQMVALRALHLALDQVPDGGTFVWRKKSRSLKGMIRPSKAFRNSDGHICRHIIYALVLGRYTKQIEGIACRQEDGRWRL
jgi:hypothetical protein